jgi:hypothetical protein
MKVNIMTNLYLVNWIRDIGTCQSEQADVAAMLKSRIREVFGWNPSCLTGGFRADVETAP